MKQKAKNTRENQHFRQLRMVAFEKIGAAPQLLKQRGINRGNKSCNCYQNQRAKAIARRCGKATTNRNESI